MANLAEFQEILGLSFSDLPLLETAVVHSSYVNENPNVITGHNERLEFLGDAILGFIVAEILHERSPALDEGEMTKLRSALVRRDTLARVARTIKLGDYLDLGKGEETSGGRSKTANLAGALEAVIAAIYLDQGLKTTRDFIVRLLGQEMAEVVSQGTGVDYKTQLQEFLQSKQVIPSYRLLAATGPDHDKSFTIEVMAGDSVLGRGTGKSKKSAEAEAARIALEHITISFTQ
ncbi:ribonuclease III [Chloroflexota bacterium]